MCQFFQLFRKITLRACQVFKTCFLEAIADLIFILSTKMSDRGRSKIRVPRAQPPSVLVPIHRHKSIGTFNSVKNVRHMSLIFTSELKQIHYYFCTRPLSHRFIVGPFFLKKIVGGKKIRFLTFVGDIVIQFSVWQQVLK